MKTHVLLHSAQARLLALAAHFVTLAAAKTAFAGPPRCTDLEIDRAQGTRVVLKWTSPVPVSPEVLLELDIRMSNVPISTLNFNSRTRCDLVTDAGSPGIGQSVSITGLTLNTTYYFALKNRTASGWSTMSNLVSVTTGGPLASVTLAWDPNNEPEVTGYRLYYGTESGTYTSVIDVGNLVDRELSDLAYGTTYYFAVTAYSADGLESPLSNEVSYTP